jgi:hypothetical protein
MSRFKKKFVIEPLLGEIGFSCVHTETTQNEKISMS